jgi:predicted phosphodiesterase
LRENLLIQCFDGFRFGIYHGTNSSPTEATIQSGIYDVFIHGHTHKIREKKIGKTLVLNPGTAHKKVKSTSSVFEGISLRYYQLLRKESLYLFLAVLQYIIYKKIISRLTWNSMLFDPL